MIQSPAQRNIYYFSFYNGKLRRSNNPTKATNIFVNQVISNNKNSLQIYQQTIKGEKLEVCVINDNRISAELQNKNLYILPEKINTMDGLKKAIIYNIFVI